MPRGALSATGFKHSKHTHIRATRGARRLNKCPQVSTHTQSEEEAGDVPIGGSEFASARSAGGHWDVILLAPDAAEQRTRNAQYYERDTSKMMLPIWSTNNVINSGHRSSSSGRRVNPPSPVTSPLAGTGWSRAGRLRPELFWNIPPKLLHMTRGVKIFGRRER